VSRRVGSICETAVRVTPKRPWGELRSKVIAAPAADDRLVHGESASAVERQRAYGVRRQFQALRAMRPRQVVSLLSRAYADWSSVGAARLGAALAYFTLFSVAPILIVVTGIVGFFIGQAAATGQVAPWLERLLSRQGAEAAELMLKQAATPAGGIVTTAGGLLTLFLGASLLVDELRYSLNVVWRVQQPPSTMGLIASVRAMARDRLYAFLIVVGAGLLVLASLVVNTTVTAAAIHFEDWLPLPAALLQIINFIVSFGVTTTMFTLVYKTVPDAHVAWGDAFVGALVTAFLFTVGTMALSMFMGTAGGASVYGSAASVLALLMWVYYSAQVFFFGAEVTRIFANEYGARIVPHYRSFGGLWRRL
jgi:membrane protein